MNEDENSDVADVNEDDNSPATPESRIMLETLSPPDVQTLFTVLKLPNRPSSTAAKINSICVIPLLGLRNKPTNIKTAAKKVDISGSDKQVIQALIKLKRLDIIYRIQPHTAEQWEKRINDMISTHQLGPVTQEDLVLAADIGSGSSYGAGSGSSSGSGSGVGCSIGSGDGASRIESPTTKVQTYVVMLNNIKIKMKEVRANLREKGDSNLEKLQPIREKIDVIKESIGLATEFAKDLATKINVQQDSTLKELSYKWDTLNESYVALENGIRLDFNKFVRTIDMQLFESIKIITPQERTMIQNILDYVCKYETVFRCEYPQDIEEIIKSLRAMTRKRPREGDEDLGGPSKRAKGAAFKTLENNRGQEC